MWFMFFKEIGADLGFYSGNRALGFWLFPGINCKFFQRRDEIENDSPYFQAIRTVKAQLYLFNLIID